MVNQVLKYLITLALCALFANAFIVSDNLVDGVWTAKTFYFYGVSLIVFAFGVIKLLFNKLEYKLSLTSVDIALLLFYVYSVLRLLFTEYVPTYNARIIIFTFLIIYYFVFKAYIKAFTLQKFTPGFLLILSFLAAGFWQACLGNFQAQQLLGYFATALGSSGTFGNPAPYTGYIISVLPFALGLYVFLNGNSIYEKILKYAGGLTFAVSLAVLPATRTRGGWLAAASGIIFILWNKYQFSSKIQNVLNTKLKKYAAAVTTIVLLAVLLTGLYNIRPASAFGRLLIWKVTANIIADNPLFGIGYDRFGQVYNRYQGEYFAEKERDEYEKYVAGNVKQAHNEYIETSAELGIVGLFLFLSIFYAVFKKYKPENIESVSEYGKINIWLQILSKASILSLLVYSFFCYPFQILPSLINFILLLSLTGNVVKKFEMKPVKSKSIYKLSGFALIFYLLIAFSFMENRNYENHKTWNEAVSLSSFRMYDKAIILYDKLYNDLKHSGNFMLNYGGTLALAGKYENAVQILEKTKNLSSEHNVYLNLGNCYQMTNSFENAETCYIFASNMIPNKVYPKYLLVRCYLKTGNSKKAKEIAEYIMNMKVKIISPAESQIKNELKKIFNNELPNG